VLDCSLVNTHKFSLLKVSTVAYNQELGIEIRVVKSFIKVFIGRFFYAA